MADDPFASLSKAASNALEAGLIKTVCFISPSDKYTVEAARYGRLSGKPLAQSMLDHYLKGTATDVAVDTDKLMRDDPILARYIIAEIKKEMAAGNTSGSVPVAQERYSQQDWRMALGSINMQWVVISGSEVEIWFVNLYRWHPTAARVTQCVHQAAENLKAAGAAEFKMIGARHRIIIP